jgi:hypothetical protein
MMDRFEAFFPHKLGPGGHNAIWIADCANIKDVKPCHPLVPGLFKLITEPPEVKVAIHPIPVSFGTNRDGRIVESFFQGGYYCSTGFRLILILAADKQYKECNKWN